MSRTIEQTIYTFDELSDQAKERARDWYRRCLDENDYDAVIEDAVRIGEMLGIEFDTHAVPLMGGGTRYEPNIWWQGFSSQGDGACFEGTYRYRKGAAKEIRGYAPQDGILHSIADRLQAIQKENMYQIVASVKNYDRYTHANSPTINVEREDERSLTRGAEEEVEDCLRGFMHWIYSQLESENDYLNSDENIDEAILANEYEFDEDGDRA